MEKIPQSEAIRNHDLGPVEAEIRGLMGQALVRGASDVEKDLFERIIADLRARRVTTVEALRRAQSILDGKQDYH